MLNINQNFDLKAPVFNFDRDYFNSVEELNAYDASNVPNHFVTNVGGMLYQFTDGGWRPIIGTTDGDVSIHIGDGVTLDQSRLTFSSHDDTNHLKLNVDSEARVVVDSNSANANLFPDRLVIIGQGTKIALNAHDELAMDNYDCPVNIQLVSQNYSDMYDCGMDINPAIGLECTAYDENGDDIHRISCGSGGIVIDERDENQLLTQLSIDPNRISIAKEGWEQFDISYSNEGCSISGIHGLKSYINPSATKVWATDGSTVDLSTKANTYDVLLKQSGSGGYYIEDNNHTLGMKAFATNSKCTASGDYSHAEGDSVSIGNLSHAEGSQTVARGVYSHAEGRNTTAGGMDSHAEGYGTLADSWCSHAEGKNTTASGFASHVQGYNNVVNINAIHSVGIGNDTTRKNSEYIYAKNNTNSTALVDDPKNGYKYLIGVGGYDGISTDNTTYKSVQEVIADLTARIEQLEAKVKALETANTPA